MASLPESGRQIVEQPVQKEPQDWESVTLRNRNAAAGQGSSGTWQYRNDPDGTTYDPSTLSDDPGDPDPIFASAASIGITFLFLGTDLKFTRLNDDGTKEDVEHPSGQVLQALGFVGVAPVDALKSLIKLTREHRAQAQKDREAAALKAAQEGLAQEKAAEEARLADIERREAALEAGRLP